MNTVDEPRVRKAAPRAAAPLEDALASGKVPALMASVQTAAAPPEPAKTPERPYRRLAWFHDARQSCYASHSRSQVLTAAHIQNYPATPTSGASSLVCHEVHMNNSCQPSAGNSNSHQRGRLWQSTARNFAAQMVSNFDAHACSDRSWIRPAGP